jgi:hypothetical protein
MTFLGKLLVLLNLGLSWIFAAWALGLYTHRVDWAPRPKVAGAPVSQAAEPSRIEELSGQIKAAYDFQAPAEVRYQANLAALQKLETQLAQQRAWYADQLHIIRTGQNLKGEDAPVLELTVNNGQLVLDPAGRQPIMINDRPALSLNAYHKKIKDLQQEVDREQKEIAKLVQDFKKLTDQIAKEQVLISDQQARLGRQKDEVKTLTPLLLNYTAEGELLKKRFESLSARLKELDQLPPAAEAP